MPFWGCQLPSLDYACALCTQAFRQPLGLASGSNNALDVRTVCDCLLDLLPHPDGRHPRQDGPPGHPLPRPRQHLQHRHHQHPKGETIFTRYETHPRASHIYHSHHFCCKGGGFDCHRSVDAGLYPLCLWRPDRVSNPVQKMISH